jgi:lysozyme family protein
MMPNVRLTQSLRDEYEQLFDSCMIRPERVNAVQEIVGDLYANRSRYQSVAGALGIPWFFVAVIHNMEAGRDFTKHLHNGDPLSRRTVHVPAGRPKGGSPPFSWEESANDALSLKRLSAETDWSLAGTLYQIERYNGWGYRLYHPHVLSPYLWSFSRHYRSGKYIADGTWSDTAVSRQCGAAVLLRRMAEIHQIEFRDRPIPGEDSPPLIVKYAKRKSRDPLVLSQAQDLQRWLNTYPGIFLKVDGVPGGRTSEAFKRVTGHYLPGDPRHT